MPKDKDLMRDTGGKHKTKDLQRPERTDRKKHRHEGDKDFDDVNKDSDLQMGRKAHVARRLVKLARELIGNDY